jgi:pyruvate,water dikinase
LFTPELRATGHAVQSLDWYHPTLGELALEIEAPEASEERRRRLTETRRAAETRARDALTAKPKVLAEFEAALAVAQRLQPMREEMSLDFTLGWPVMRRALARIGAELVSRGVIDEPDQVHFLTREELVSGTASLGETAARRRVLWERQRRLTPPLVLGEVNPRMQAILDWAAGSRSGRAVGKDVFTGIAASAGRATGPARIIRSTGEFDRLQAGDILVAPATTPAWTPLFERAAAVVTDTGSLGSHSSQVAREYGIPAVVCTGDATRRLADGQLVIVDGSAGVVEVGS